MRTGCRSSSFAEISGLQIGRVLTGENRSASRGLQSGVKQKSPQLQPCIPVKLGHRSRRACCQLPQRKTTFLAFSFLYPNLLSVPVKLPTGNALMWEVLNVGKDLSQKFCIIYFSK